MLSVDGKYFADLPVSAPKSNRKMLVAGLWLKPQFILCGSFCHQGMTTGRLSVDPSRTAVQGRRGRRATAADLPSSPFLNVLSCCLVHI